MSDDKVFAPLFVKAGKFDLRISGKAEELIDFVNENANAEGYINMLLKKSREGKYYIELDTWVPDSPKGNTANSRDKSKGYDKKNVKGTKSKETYKDKNAGKPIGEDDDLPF